VEAVKTAVASIVSELFHNRSEEPPTLSRGTDRGRHRGQTGRFRLSGKMSIRESMLFSESQLLTYPSLFELTHSRQAA